MLPIPVCMKCQKPVDQMQTQVDHASGVIHVTVLCHGEQETKDSNMNDLLGVAITGARAFEVTV